MPFSGHLSTCQILSPGRTHRVLWGLSQASLCKLHRINCKSKSAWERSLVLRIPRVSGLDGCAVVLMEAVEGSQVQWLRAWVLEKTGSYLITAMPRSGISGKLLKLPLLQSPICKNGYSIVLALSLCVVIRIEWVNAHRCAWNMLSGYFS